MQKNRSIFNRFCCDERGVTAIEFAFVSPVLLFFIFGILEFAMIFLASNMLENAVNDAARTGKTGYVQSGVSREQTLLNEISARVGGLLDPSQVTLTTTTYDSLDQVGQGEPFTDQNANGIYDAGEPYTDSNHNGDYDSDIGSDGLGNSGQVVVYNISYPWHMMTPLLGNFIGTDGIFNLSTHVVVKNEPYTDSNS